MSDLGWKVKGQTWPLELPLNISSENNAFGFHSIKKINFSQKKKSNLNALGSEFDLMLSRSRST